MPRKKSVPLCAQQFRKDQGDILRFCAQSEKRLRRDRHITLVYDAAIIKIHAAFERMILGALVGAINNDTSMLSNTTQIDFPKHLTDEVCEYIITGGGYFDFKRRDGLIREIRKYVPEGHYLLKAVRKAAYRESLERLCSLRNFAAHESPASKKQVLKDINQERVGAAGSWLKRQNRLQAIANDLSALSKEIEANAPH